MDKKKINHCFKDFKDIHKGETIYIIGNGPSLSATDLNLIKNSPSIAMNRISLIYEKYKSWRPKYYIFCSSNISNPIWGKDWAESVMKALSCKKTTSFIDNRCKECVKQIKTKNTEQKLYEIFNLDPIDNKNTIFNISIYSRNRNGYSAQSNKIRFIRLKPNERS